MTKYTDTEKRTLIGECNAKIASLTLQRPIQVQPDGHCVVTDQEADRALIKHIKSERAFALKLRGACDPYHNSCGSSL